MKSQNSLRKQNLKIIRKSVQRKSLDQGLISLGIKLTISETDKIKSN